jgi:hypothetical protein
VGIWQKAAFREDELSRLDASCYIVRCPRMTHGLPTNRPQCGGTRARDPECNAGVFISELKLATAARSHEELPRKGFYQVLASMHSNHVSSATPNGSLDHGTSSASKLEELESGSGRTRPSQACPPPPLIDDRRRNRAISIRERRRGSPARRNGHSREPQTPESRSKTGRPILR